jgi:hypothetical protein
MKFDIKNNLLFMHSLKNFKNILISQKGCYKLNKLIRVLVKGFARGSPRSVLLAFSQSYIEHYLRKNKIVVSFFC